MFASLLLFAVAKFPSGVYRAAEFCKAMHEATGESYQIDSELSDYPLFVSVKSGEAERVKSLVAVALRATWRKDGEYNKLVPLKIDPKEDFPEFERQYKLATASSPIMAQLSPAQIYDIPPGTIQRFGYPTGPNFKAFPPELEKKVRSSPGGDGYIAVRRLAEGLFESRADVLGNTDSAFSSGASIDFTSLPDDIAMLVGPAKDRQFMKSDDLAKVSSVMQDVTAMQKAVGDLSKDDAVTYLAKLIFPSLAEKLDTDLCLAIPDVGMFPMGIGQSSPPTLGVLMGRMSGVLNWKAVDGAIVGRRPSSDRLGFSQVNRTVLANLVKSIGANGVVNIKELGDYVSKHRPVASNQWTDAMMLVMSGIVLDEQYLGDYPYNVRFYTRLADNDWSLMKGGNHFAVSALSKNAETALYDLLLQARSRLEGSASDPALWRTLDRDQLLISGGVTDENVLICWGGTNPNVYTPSMAGASYAHMKQRAGREIMYTTATRKKLNFKVHPGDPESGVESGFTEVVPLPGAKAVSWQDLPEAYLKEFKLAKEARQAPEPAGGGVPPPSNRIAGKR